MQHTTTLKCSVVLLLTMCLCLCVPHATAETLREGEYCYQVVEGGVLLTEWFGWEDGDVPAVLEVPATLGGSPVVGIGRLAFALGLDDHLPEYSIVIPEGVTYLQESVFDCCFDVKTISLPSTLQSMPEECIGLTTASIVFPNGNPFFSLTDGYLVDERTGTLLHAERTAVQKPIPPVRRLGRMCFLNWEGREFDEIVLPETLESVGVCFYNAIVHKLALPDSVQQLDPWCFSGHSSTEFVLSAGLKEIPPYCFAYCDIPQLTIPEGVEWIGEYAFGFSFLEMDDRYPVILPESVTFVGYNAFMYGYEVIPTGDTHFETKEEFLLRCPEGELFP